MSLSLEENELSTEELVSVVADKIDGHDLEGVLPEQRIDAIICAISTRVISQSRIHAADPRQLAELISTQYHILSVDLADDLDD